MLTKARRSLGLRKIDLFAREAVVVPPYTVSALIYDQMMREVDYRSWSKYLLKLMRLASPQFLPSRMRGKRVCELACGTGNLSEILSDTGLNMTGIDMSSDMINAATSKQKKNARPGPRYVNDDMTSYRSPERFDGAICVYDSINYLPTRNSLKKFFGSVYANLNYGGVFVFDASLESNSLGDASNFEQRGRFKGIVYQRQSSYDRDSKVHTTYVRVAIDGEVSEEIHREHVYSMTVLRTLFGQAGFVERFAAGDFTLSEADDRSDRVHFVLVRPGHD